MLCIDSNGTNSFTLEKVDFFIVKNEKSFSYSFSIPSAVDNIFAYLNELKGTKNVGRFKIIKTNKFINIIFKKEYFPNKVNSRSVTETITLKQNPVDISFKSVSNKEMPPNYPKKVTGEKNQTLMNTINAVFLKLLLEDKIKKQAIINNLNKRTISLTSQAIEELVTNHFISALNMAGKEMDKSIKEDYQINSI